MASTNETVLTIFLVLITIFGTATFISGIYDYNNNSRHLYKEITVIKLLFGGLFGSIGLFWLARLNI